MSDEAWQQLMAETRVDEREARALRRSALTVAAALTVVVSVWGLGLASPRLAHGDSSGGTSDPTAHTAQYDFDLVNRGFWPVSVVGASTNVPGVAVTSMTPRSLQVSRTSTRHLQIALHVEDCTAAEYALQTTTNGASPPLRVLVERPWGTITTDVRPPDPSWITDLILYACGQEPR